MTRQGQGISSILGLNMNALEVSFLVPRYIIEGDAARGIKAMASDLKSVSDLPRYAHVFQNPDRPDRGLFHNCIIGWQCELVNNDKMEAYGLNEHFSNFRLPSADALETSLANAYKDGKAWLGYYWGPTWVLGEFDMVALEEPEYSDDCWKEGDHGCAFPPSVVNIAVSGEFAKSVGVSGEMIQFLEAYEMDQLLISKLLAYMRANNANAQEAARYFLKTEEDVWTAWVSSEVAQRVRATLQ